MSSWTSYPKIFAIGHRWIKDIFEDEVLIEEKVDGSQFSFGVFIENGERVIRCRSKGCQLNVEYPEKMFAAAVETVKEIQDLLVQGWTYRGEYLARPKHNSLAYDRIPKKHIMIFDICMNEECYLAYGEKKILAERAGLECVPKIFEGKIESPDEILNFLDRESVLGGQKIEGFVVKNYHKITEDKKTMMGKYVSEAFKEVHNKEWKKTNASSNDIIQRLILDYKTPARWNKSIQRLRDVGKLTDSPKDIGLLIKSCQEDILEECEHEIKDKLFNWAKGKILRGCVGGLPEHYKEYLLKKSFKGE